LSELKGKSTVFEVNSSSILKDFASNKMEQKYFLAMEYSPKPVAQSAWKS